ncbi:MAG: hypothetical protein RL424_600, partial [Pseudomonadota bacterium]
LVSCKCLQGRMHSSLDATDIAGAVVNNGNHFGRRAGLELSLGGRNGVMRQSGVMLNGHA